MAIHSKTYIDDSLYTCCYTSSGGIRVKQFLKKVSGRAVRWSPRHTAELPQESSTEKYAVLDIAC